MINSRLYYDFKELIQGIFNFYYYTVELDAAAADLRSYTKVTNQQEVLSTLDKIGIKNLLFNLNGLQKMDIPYQKIRIHRNWISKKQLILI